MPWDFHCSSYGVGYAKWCSRGFFGRYTIISYDGVAWEVYSSLDGGECIFKSLNLDDCFEYVSNYDLFFTEDLK